MGNCTLVAFDGLSLAGKSTMVQMLFERSANAVIVRENTLDPLRSSTSRASKLLKEMEPAKAVYCLCAESPQFGEIFNNALLFSNNYKGDASKQALLAYLFTAGRKYVDDYVRSQILNKDIILDRWQMTGWAYQVAPGFPWQAIRELNAQFKIIKPDVQILLICPLEQIPIRRVYRDKLSVGTAGQISRGKEETILTAFKEIYACLKTEMTIYSFENTGEPVDGIWLQVRQAISTFEAIEKAVRLTPFNFSSVHINEPEIFWRDSDRLSRIQERQCSAK